MGNITYISAHANSDKPDKHLWRRDMVSDRQGCV